MNSAAHTGQVLEVEQRAALDGAMVIFLLSRCDGSGVSSRAHAHC